MHDQKSRVSSLPAIATWLRYALRRMRRTPHITAGVVLSFALGIGANAAVFIVVDRLLLSPPAHIAHPERVRKVVVDRVIPSIGTRERTDVLSYPDFLDLTQARAFESVAAVSRQKLTFGHGLEAKQHDASLVSGGFFQLLVARATAGRLLSPDDDRLGAPGVAVISYGMWHREFGDDPKVIGHTLDFGFGPYTIVGVAPKGFTGADLRPVDVWLPLEPAGHQLMGTLWPSSRDLNWLHVVVRLRTTISVAAAQAEATVLHRQGRRDQIRLGTYDSKAKILVASLVAARGPGAPGETIIATWLAGVSILVLLITCANVAILMLAKSASQRRELAIRLALGSGRSRLLAGIVSETLLLAGVGAGAAFLVAQWTADALGNLVLPDVAWAESQSATRVLLCVVVLAVISGAAASVIPAIQASHEALGSFIREQSRGISHRNIRARNGLIVLQVALSMTLLVGAGLFTESFRRAASLDLGFDSEGLLLVTGIFDRGATPSRVTAFAPDAARRLRDLPGVEGATIDVSVPFNSAMATPLRVPGLDSIPLLATGGPTMHAVDAEYFKTLRVNILRGRGLEPTDDRLGADRVVVVNETMARVLWPGKQPIGQCLMILSDLQPADRAPCATVIGVVANTHRSALIEGATMQYYFPAAQRITDDAPTTILVRLRGRPESVVPSIRRLLLNDDPELRYVDIVPLQQLIEPQTRSWRLGATTFMGFGLLALIVAGIGLYSVLAFEVSQRRFELAIRAALGATKAHLRRIIAGRALHLMGMGIILGTATTGFLVPQIQPLLFRTKAFDPLIFVAVIASVLLLAVTASVVPVRRALRADVTDALRAE